jgi:hypothetical protein
MTLQSYLSSIPNKKTVSDSSKTPMKNHNNQTTNKNNNSQKQVRITKTKIVPQKVLKQENTPKLENYVVNLIRKTCVN